MAQEVLLRTVDFGVLTFNPPESELLSLLLGTDELVLLVRPDHPLAGPQAGHDGGDRAPDDHRAQRSVAGARARAAAVRTAARAAEHPHFAAEPRRDQARGRDRASAWRSCRGAARSAKSRAASSPRCACRNCVTPRQLRFVYRRDGDLSHAAQAFLEACEDAKLALGTQNQVQSQVRRCSLPVRSPNPAVRQSCRDSARHLHSVRAAGSVASHSPVTSACRAVAGSDTGNACVAGRQPVASPDPG